MPFNNEPFRLFWRFASDAGAFSATSTAEGYDVNNLKRDTLDKKWKSETAGGASYDNVFVDLSSEGGNPRGMAFRSDGLKMYILQLGAKKIFQYSLSAAWDVGTATYDSVFLDISTEDTTAYGITFKPDGTKLYMVGDANNRIFQYNLSSGWDLSTAVYSTLAILIGAEDNNPRGVAFKSDGLKMYMSGDATNSVYQYTLGTAWNVSTAVYDIGVTKSFASEDTSPQNIFIKPDGTKLYMVGDNSNQIFQYSLGVAWDLSTLSYDSVFLNVASEDQFPTTVSFKTDGLKMYMAGFGTASAYQYSLGVGWELSDIRMVTVDLGSAQSITAFAFLGHNIEATDTIVLRYASDSGFTANTGTVPLTFRADTLIEYFTAVSRQYWRLEITPLVAASREAGRFVLGDHYQTGRNVALGWSGPQYTEDTSKNVRTAGGQQYSDIGFALKSLRASFTAVGEDDLDEFEDLKSMLLTGASFIISQNWTDYPLKRTLYGSLKSMGQPTNVAADKWTISLSMTEQK